MCRLSTESDRYHRAGHSLAATVVRSVPVRLVEVSRRGCLVECPTRLEPGASGLLSVKLAGSMRFDDLRVSRCPQRVGGGTVYRVGAEFLNTRRLGRRTVRTAVTTIISDQRGGGRLVVEDPRVVNDGVSGRSVGRGPPA
jgi:hypothetical protein